jgi:drug/metabolite transporter (DMT)-like permease
MWLLLVPHYIQTLRQSTGLVHTLSWQMRAAQYTAGGVITALITVLRNVSINVMPGSVFALLISTSILFSVALSKLFMGAALNAWHYAAVLACLGSAGAIAGTALLTSEEDVPGSNFPLGIPAALAAAFFVAVMGTMQEVFQQAWKGACFDLYMLEMTLSSALVASVLIVAFGGAVGELTQWTPALAAAQAAAAPLHPPSTTPCTATPRRWWCCRKPATRWPPWCASVRRRGCRSSPAAAALVCLAVRWWSRRRC